MRYISRRIFQKRMRDVSVPGSLNKDVFERSTSTGSEICSFSICIDTIKSVLLDVFTLIEMICPKSWAKPLLKNPLQVDFRLSSITTLLLDIGVNSVNYF